MSSHNQQISNRIQSTKNIENFKKISHDRRSLISTPLVEVDILGMSIKSNSSHSLGHKGLYRQNSFKDSSPALNTRKVKANFSFIESFAEVVEEEKQEDEKLIRKRKDRFKLPKDKNEFNKKYKRGRSTEIDRCVTTMYNQIGNVSEKEEEISD